MTELSKRLAVGFAALAAAGVIGGVTAVSLTSGTDQPAQVRTVSDEATTMPASSAPASPTATAAPAAAASSPAAVSSSAAPAKTAAKTTTRTRSRTVTEATTTEPAAEPTPTEEATGTADLKPDPGPPPPTLKRCYNEHGDEVPCP